MMVGCDWCISNCNVPARSYSLRRPLLYIYTIQNFNSIIPVDVIRVKSYVDSLLDSAGVQYQSRSAVKYLQIRVR